MADRNIRIRDLPDALSTHISKYLLCPSAVAFAVAMSPSRQCYQQGASGAILASLQKWTDLDLGQVEKSMASKLSDGDIHAILDAIDAVNNLRTLKLTGCIGIRGVALAPLEGSVVLENIDLGVGSARNGANPLLSSEQVLPIISSIVEVWTRRMPQQPNHSLVVSTIAKYYLDYPSFWGDDPALEQFLKRYTRILTPVLLEPKPKRPFPPFFYYSTAARNDVKAANPNATFAEIARIIAMRFNTLPKGEIAYWNHKAVIDKEHYRKEMLVFSERKRLRFKNSPESIVPRQA